ncbi:hypothetical protein, partial [Arthrobacter sp. UCD-GKA]|uniref:hypothetical protein n=1 Tax=Arthrobacter sp. UCD-GKA TaxID=1913576 RepID=UPI001587A66D
LMLVPAGPVSAQPTSVPIQSAKDTPPPAPTGVGVRLLDIPAATQKDPRARSYIVDRLAPGTEITRRIEVTNNSGTAQSVRIYAGAAHIEDGSFVGGNDPAINELTTWTSFDQPALELESGAAAKVAVTIDVPADAAEDEQYAALWAEIRNEPAPGTNMIQASRAGIRVYLSIGPGNGKPANFSIDDLSPGRNQNGDPEVATTVTNIGGRALDITGSLKLADGPGGLSAGPNPIDQGTTIAPGESAAVRATLPAELPNGPWEATLRLKSGLVSHEAKATIVFPDAIKEPVDEPDARPNLALIAGGIALVAIIVGAVLWWVRRRNRVAS